MPPKKWRTDEDIRAYHKAYRAKHREKRVAYMKAYNLARTAEHLAADPHRFTNRSRAKRIEQAGRAPGLGCEICGIAFTGPGEGLKQTSPRFDHDHETGVFRGWLCGSCNSGLGLLGDTEDRIRLALMYLMKAKCLK